MPKKNSSKVPATALENSSRKVDESSPTPKKPGLEIDEIFSAKKRKKSEQEKAEKLAVTTKTNESKKKSSSKTPVFEKPMVEEDGPTTTSRKPSNEIDEIFLIKKRKKEEQVELEKQLEDAAVKANKTKKKKIKRKEPKEKVFLDPPARPRKRTGDGLIIYTEEELGFGKAAAGGTRLCPFDCDCCF